MVPVVANETIAETRSCEHPVGGVARRVRGRVVSLRRTLYRSSTKADGNGGLLSNVSSMVISSQLATDAFGLPSSHQSRSLAQAAARSAPRMMMLCNMEFYRNSTERSSPRTLTSSMRDVPLSSRLASSIADATFERFNHDELTEPAWPNQLENRLAIAQMDPIVASETIAGARNYEHPLNGSEMTRPRTRTRALSATAGLSRSTRRATGVPTSVARTRRRSWWRRAEVAAP